MKKRIFRLIAGALSCMVALFVFSACKGDEGTGSNGGENPVPVAPVVSYYTVVFLQENTASVPVEVEVGKTPEASQIPALTQRAGYDVAWSVSDFSSFVGGDIVSCYAVYTPKTYEVSYNVNGGVELAEKTQVFYQREYLLKTPVREGYTFTHWTDEAGNKVALSGSAWRVAENVTLTAQWRANTPNEYSVVFQQEGAEDIVYFVKEGESLTHPVPALNARVGYTAEWVVNGATPDFSAISSNLTVTPKYTPKSYVVGFDTDGGNTLTETFTVTYGQAYDFSGVQPEKAGFYFVNGWYYGAESVSNTGIWVIDGEQTVTLTAKWSVKVTFRQSGVADQVFYYLVGSSVSKAELPAVTPKDGYVVQWEKSAIEKLTNLQGDVVVTAVEQSLTWSPSK